MKSSLNWEVSSIHSKSLTGSFWEIAQPYKLFTFQYQRYYDSLVFVIVFHVFVISLCIPMNCMTYSTSNSFLNH